MPPTPPLFPSSCVLSPFELALFLTPFFLSFFLFSQKKEHVTAILLSWKGKNFFRGDNDFSAFQGGWIRALKWAIHTLAFYHEKVSRWRGGVDYENIMPRLRRVKGISRGGGRGVYTLEEYRARQKRLRGWRFSLDLAKIHGKTSPLFASY